MNGNLREAIQWLAQTTGDSSLLETRCFAYLNPAGEPVSNLELHGVLNPAIEIDPLLPNGPERAQLMESFLGAGFGIPYRQDPAALPAISVIPDAHCNNRGPVLGEEAPDLAPLLTHPSNPLGLAAEAPLRRVPSLQGLDYEALLYCWNFRTWAVNRIGELFPSRPADATAVSVLPSPALAGQRYALPDGSVWVNNGSDWHQVGGQGNTGAARAGTNGTVDLEQRVARIERYLGLA